MAEKLEGIGKFDENLALRRGIDRCDGVIRDEYENPRTASPEAGLDGGHHYESVLRQKREKEAKIKENIRERLGIESGRSEKEK